MAPRHGDPVTARDNATGRAVPQTGSVFFFRFIAECSFGVTSAAEGEPIVLPISGIRRFKAFETQDL